MRYYIEAFDIDGLQILGNLDGQAALGEMLAPRRAKAWTRLRGGRNAWGSRVHEFRLVDAHNKVLERIYRTEVL